MTNESKKTPVSFNPSADRLRTPTGPVSAAGRMGVPAADTGHNPQDLDSLRKIAEAHGVRPGPWHVYDRGIGYEVHDDSGYELTGGMRETFDKPDAEFIATFDPPTILELIAEIESLRTRFSAMRASRDSERSRADKNANKLEQAEQAVQRVREVHCRMPVKVNFDAQPTDFCKYCYVENLDESEFPCPTIRALDGDIRG